MKMLLSIFAIFIAFTLKAQFGFDGLHDDRALEKLILNYVENGVVEFKIKCRNCRAHKKKFNYRLLNDSTIIETSGSKVIQFAIGDRKLEWIQTREDSLYLYSLPAHFEMVTIDSFGRSITRIYKITENDTVLSTTLYTIEYKDSSKIEKHIVPNSSHIHERKITTYAFASDSTREVIYDKIGENWVFFKDVTSWTDSITSINKLVIQENSISKTIFFGRTLPEIVESKNLVETKFYYNDGIIKKIKITRSELNLVSNDLFKELIELKPKIIKINNQNSGKQKIAN